ncbi:MAG: hypothetical protein LBQ54_10500 [Planctomycetaceae bacterium]|jgi:hypothetical protein|nr:hypothetical protein [Planctomycetaceae bacterium]
MMFSIIHVAAGDLVQLLVFMLVMGFGALMKYVSNRQEVKKQQAHSKLAENMTRTAPQKSHQKSPQSERRPIRKPEPVDAVHLQSMTPVSSKIKRPLVTKLPPEIAVSESAFPEVSLQPAAENRFAADIHRLLHDPQHVCQAVVLGEVLKRRAWTHDWNT